MQNIQPYYNKTFKKAIIAFGSIFSGITIERSNEDGSEKQTVKVPIAQAPKEKWVVRIDSDPDLTNHSYISLPRMSFEITGFTYDPARKVNRINKISCPGENGTASYAYAPVPYNIDMSLYILTKTQEDAFQIVEQILPYFNPEFTLGIKALDQLNVITDVPVILNSISYQDEYDGSFEMRRFVTYTLTFTMKLNLFGPVNENGKIITKTIVDVGNLSNKRVDPDQALIVFTEGDPETGEIQEYSSFRLSLDNN